MSLQAPKMGLPLKTKSTRSRPDGNLQDPWPKKLLVFALAKTFPKTIQQFQLKKEEFKLPGTGRAAGNFSSELLRQPQEAITPIEGDVGHMFNISWPPNVKRTFINLLRGSARCYQRFPHSCQKHGHQRQLSSLSCILIVAHTIIPASIPAPITLTPPPPGDAILRTCWAHQFWFSSGHASTALTMVMRAHQNVRRGRITPVTLPICVWDVVQGVDAVIFGFTLVQWVYPRVAPNRENCGHGGCPRQDVSSIIIHFHGESVCRQKVAQTMWLGVEGRISSTCHSSSYICNI